MSYALARAQLVSILEGITPSTKTLIQTPFKHVERLEGNLTSRSFTLRANQDGDGGVTGPYTPDLSGQPRMTYTMTLAVTYRAQVNEGALDLTLASDQRDIAIALLTPANWNRPTSGIISITDAPFYLPTRRFEVDGHIEVRSTFPLAFY